MGIGYAHVYVLLCVVIVTYSALLAAVADDNIGVRRRPTIAMHEPSTVGCSPSLQWVWLGWPDQAKPSAALFSNRPLVCVCVCVCVCLLRLIAKFTRNVVPNVSTFVWAVHHFVRFPLTSRLQLELVTDSFDFKRVVFFVIFFCKLSYA